MAPRRRHMEDTSLPNPPIKLDRWFCSTHLRVPVVLPSLSSQLALGSPISRQHSSKPGVPARFSGPDTRSGSHKNDTAGEWTWGGKRERTLLRRRRETRVHSARRGRFPGGESVSAHRS
ncbi:hypothetical protein B296_00009435 [Ensete ventricosum]|uniref:Uncharacterized protein n=1 Tax=Ensete ventricosum TaxID=4639 RepID=A0A426ZKV4_ENSVE|nr:hypothetical protein B296_00009435 [Ensete ventricosum]